MITLIERHDIAEKIKVSKRYQQLADLLHALDENKLTDDTINLINQEIEQLNALSSDDKRFVRAIKTKETSLIRLLEKRHKIVPKKYYRKLWMALGISAFGVPVGIAFGLSVGNLGLLGLGFPIGMAIGVGIGNRMDQKAFEEGRQLDFEVKY